MASERERAKAHDIPFNPFSRSPWYKLRPAPPASPVSIPSGEFLQGKMVLLGMKSLFV